MQIYLKREEINHTGDHMINHWLDDLVNTVNQVGVVDGAADFLLDNGEDDLERLLNNITAGIDAGAAVSLSVAVSDTSQQNIVVENIDLASLGLGAGSSSNDIITVAFG